MALTLVEQLVADTAALRQADSLAQWHLLNTADLAEPLPPVPWLCEAIGMAPGAVSLVAGYGYSRKTMALQSLALSVAAGRPAWGVYSVRRGPVLHLDYEQGRRLTQERYQRLARGIGLDLQELPEGQLRVACMPRVYLETQAAVDSLLPLVEGAALVIVDSLKAAFPHADENSSDVRSYLDAMNRLSERTGVVIAMIHHARKPNPQQGGTATHAIRGSSALFDACQSVYVLQAEKDTPTTVHHQKDRIRGATCEDFGLTSEDVAGPSGPRWGLRVTHLEAEQMADGVESQRLAKEAARTDRARETVRATLARFNGTFRGSRNDLVAHLGGNRASMQRAVTLMIADGQLRSDGRGEGRVWYSV